MTAAENSDEKKWYERLSAMNLVMCFILAAVGSYTTILVTQTDLNGRLRALEQTAQERKVEHDKQISELRDDTLPRREFGAHWESVKEMILAIREDVKYLREKEERERKK